MAQTVMPLADLALDVDTTALLWQAGLIGLAVFVGWLVTKTVARRLDRTTVAADPHLGLRAVLAIASPLVALAILLVGRSALGHFVTTRLIGIAIAVLTTLALQRFALLLIRQVFRATGLQQPIARAVSWALWLGLALHLTGLAPDVLEALAGAELHVGRQSLSLLLILQGLIALFTAVMIALWLGHYTETRLMAAETVQMSLRVMLTKFAKAGFVLLAVLIALPAVGIDITALSVFGGMLGVGIGFGLQKIAANYVSGFIVLLDRSVSIDDVVTVDKYNGRVTRMTARYVVVRSPAGTEALIPNETLVSSVVINHTYTDRRVHVDVPVQVGYETDLAAAVRILEELALAHPRVLPEPRPRVQVKALADSGINLELGVWIDDPEDGIGNVRSDLYFALLPRFAAEGIEIPFPQRELRLRPGSPAISPENRSTSIA